MPNTTNTTVNLGLEPNPQWQPIVFPDDLITRLVEDSSYRNNLSTTASRQAVCNSLTAISRHINLPHELWAGFVRYFSRSAQQFIKHPTAETLADALTQLGYGNPQAFFDEVQTRCPVTGEDLESFADFNWAKYGRFAYSATHQIMEDGVVGLVFNVVECSEVYTGDIHANEWYPASETTRWDRRSWPTAWLEANTGWCANCERRRWMNSLIYDEDSDQYCCDDGDNCLPESSAPRCALLAYNDPTANRLPSQSPRGRRMGLEIEWVYGPSFLDRNGDFISCSSRDVRRRIEEVAHQIVFSFPDTRYAILKRDGSLRVEGLDVGLELVTRPERLSVHKEILTEAWDKLPSGLLSNYTINGRSIPIGLHVHAERWGRSLLHQAKVCYFMSLVGNRSWLVDLAQRVDDRYARFPTGADWSYIHGTHANGRSECSHDPSKYVALRVLPDTLEFRLFRSHTERDGVLRCLEFVDALFEFTKFSSARELQASRFVKFIAVHRKAYPCLHKYVSPQLTPRNRTK